MRKKRKTAGLLLATVLAVSLVPMSAFAEEEASVTLDVDSVVLTAAEGYGEDEVFQTITATSTGAEDVEFVMAGFTESSMYEQFTVSAGGMSVTVKPQPGLPEGTYEAVVTIEDYNDGFAPIQVPVTFTVTADTDSADPDLDGPDFGPDFSAPIFIGPDIADPDQPGRVILRGGHTITDPSRLAFVIPKSVEPEDPAPVEPEEPAPADPEDPVPAEPEEPAPVDPEPTEPEEPTPVEPEEPAPVVPVNPSPVVPLPVQPVPAESVPEEPTPEEPAPPAPGPEEPAAEHVCPAASFLDVDTNEWYHSYVDYVIENKLMKGVTGDSFEPNGLLTRAMLAVALYRMEGSPAVTGESSFPDLEADMWYRDAVLWASQEKLIEGYEDGAFRPDQPVSRQEMAIMMQRYGEAKGFTPSAAVDLSRFVDEALVEDWAREAMEWANAADLISGKNGKRLDPEGSTTRAQAAAILMRFAEKVK